MMGFSSKQIPAGGDCWPLPFGGAGSMGTDVGCCGSLPDLREDEQLYCCSLTPSTSTIHTPPPSPSPRQFLAPGKCKGKVLWFHHFQPVVEQSHTEFLKRPALLPFGHRLLGAKGSAHSESQLSVEVLISRVPQNCLTQLQAVRILNLMKAT